MGFLHFSPQDFFILEPVECLEILEKAKERTKFDHELQYIAVMNAIGVAFSDKKNKYEYYDVFNTKKKKTQVTDKEKEDMKKYFENW